MWTTENRSRYARTGLRYPSDLTDAEWAIVAPLIPPAKRGGRRRDVVVREVLNGLLYILSTGCQWRALPKDLPPRSTVHGYFQRWDHDGTLMRIHEALYVTCREQAEREASPTACIIDSQSVKSTEKRLSCPSSVVSTFDDLTWTASLQGWRAAPPPSAASALTHRSPCQSGF
jgi:transposase